MPLVLADLESRLRIDLHDTDATAYRWTTADLDRAIDRGVIRYSVVSPMLLSVTLPTVAQMRTYPVPDGAWWVERVEYPVGLFPRRYVAFALESPVVAGGSPSFTMRLGASRLPVDGSGSIGVHAAYKHQVDASLVTVPASHIDVVLLGAYAYCCYAWGTPMADNFLFSDGEMRDRLDDTKVPGAWLKQGDDAYARFLQQLEEIRRQRDAETAAVAQWGDVPVRWNRL